MPPHLVPGLLVQVYAVIQWYSLHQLHCQHPVAWQCIDHLRDLKKLITLQQGPGGHMITVILLTDQCSFNPLVNKKKTPPNYWINILRGNGVLQLSTGLLLCNTLHTPTWISWHTLLPFCSHTPMQAPCEERLSCCLQTVLWTNKNPAGWCNYTAQRDCQLKENNTASANKTVSGCFLHILQHGNAIKRCRCPDCHSKFQCAIRFWH